MSEFVSAHLGLGGVQSRHKGVYWFGQERPYVQWVLLLLMLPCTGVLVVGVTSFRERERIPGLFRGFVCEVCVSIGRCEILCVFMSCPRCGPCLPFYSFHGKGSGYICDKKVKWEKDEREKQKRWHRVRPLSVF
jgi:hypothetical protein